MNEDAARVGRYDLDRFVTAQAYSYAAALRELRAGEKRTHWMWFVFPQIAGLGHSAMARHYAIADRTEARAYLDHALLGPRLRECCAAILPWMGQRDATAIFGPVDAMKLQSSMTLFERAADGAEPFASVLDGFYGGERDEETLRLLG